MKNFISNKGLTLLEITIVCAIVSFICLSSFMSTAALQKSTSDYGLKYVLSSSTRSTLNHILKNAAMAVGSDSTTNLGILIGAQTGNNNTFCFLQDVDPIGVPNTPATYASTPAPNRYHWLCYTLIPSDPNAHKIYYCYSSYNAGVPTACTSGDTWLGTAVSTVGQTLPTATFYPKFCMNTAAGSQASLFTMTITNRINPALPATTTGTNPEFTVTGSVKPAQHQIYVAGGTCYASDSPPLVPALKPHGYSLSIVLLFTRFQEGLLVGVLMKMRPS